MLQERGILIDKTFGGTSIFWSAPNFLIPEAEPNSALTIQNNNYLLNLKVNAFIFAAEKAMPWAISFLFFFIFVALLQFNVQMV